MGIDAEEQGASLSRSDESDTVQVLHVDDEGAFVEMAAEFLEREGDAISVETVTEPSAAIDRLTPQSTDFDCVLADYDLPGMDGLELLETLRDRGCDLPYILFTGKGSEEIASEAISAGVTDYIQKEGGSDQFAVVVNRILEAVSQRRAEKELDPNERYYRRLLESAPTPITMYDADGEYLYANGAAASFFGVGEPADLIGRTKYDLVTPAEHASIDERLRRLAAGQRVPATEHAYSCLDGQRRTGIVSCAPAMLDDAAGVSIIRDTTDQRGLDGPLDDIASVLSHDVQSPLTTLEGRIELARETEDVSHLEDAKEALDRTRHLVEDVVEVLRHEDITVEPEPLALERVSRSVWDRLDTGDATLDVADTATIDADERGLVRLFENLFRNAVAHAGANPTVTVGTREGGFYVEDDGPGIDPERRDEVFDPGHSSAGSSGLGLVSVKQIAQAHGWSVDCVASDAGGARFEITGAELRTQD